MYPKRTNRRLLRGVTLVELMAVVAIIGILAVLAVVGYRKYLRNAKSSHTKDMVLHIASGQHRYFTDTRGYVNCSTSYTDFYPGKPVAEKRQFRFEGHPDWPCWRVLRIDSDAPVYGGFVTRAGNPGEPFPQPPTAQKVTATFPNALPWFIVYAEVNQDDTGQREKLYTHSEQRDVHIENQGE